ncbi:MAG: beta-lactamase family protein [bacterium]|nr:beta-lactamase family protein [bacterium]
MIKITFSNIGILFLALLFSCKSEVNQSAQFDSQKFESSLLPPVLLKDSIINLTLTEQMTKFNVKGVSIAVIEGGKISWAKGYGIANNKDSVTSRTLFQAGSISKPIAALAALKLVQQGVLDLDADINTYLNSWSLPESKFDSTSKVTLRGLLSHTSGVNVSGFSGYTQIDPSVSLDDILNGDAKNDKIELDTIPGTQWKYSGGGYAIVQKIIEDVTNEPYFRFLQEEILAPLKMHNTVYLDFNKYNHSDGYVNGQRLENGNLVYYQPTAAGLWSTPSDLAKFCIGMQQCLKGNRLNLLSPELAKTMLSKGMNNWGLGPQLKYDSDSLMFMHDGNTKGFTASIKAFGYLGKGLVIMTNADMEQQLIPEITRTVAYNFNWGVEEPIEIEPIKLGDSELADLSGLYEYENEIPGIGKYTVKLIKKDDQLFFDDGNVQAVLLATSKNQLIMYQNGREFLFKVVDDEVLSFTLDGQFRFLKVKDPSKL